MSTKLFIFNNLVLKFNFNFNLKVEIQEKFN
jgi:hypothetical protein